MNSEKTANKTQRQGSIQEVLRKLGERIRAKRKRKGLSQEGFADLCGLHRTERWGFWSAARQFRDWTRCYLSLSISGFLFLTYYRGLSHEQEKVEDRDG